MERGMKVKAVVIAAVFLALLAFAVFQTGLNPGGYPAHDRCVAALGTVEYAKGVDDGGASYWFAMRQAEAKGCL